MNNRSVCVIDDDPGVRDALVTVLRSEDIVARGFSSGATFLAEMPDELSVCVITDIRMPGVDGLELINHVTARHGVFWPVIVMTGHAEVPSVIELMKIGAVVDFIEKPFDPQRLVETVKGCLGRLAGLADERKAIMHAQAGVRSLTNREQQVFKLVLAGHSNKEIAIKLQISPRTVEVFRARVSTKMGADSFSGLIRMGLFVPGPWPFEEADENPSQTLEHSARKPLAAVVR